MKTLLSHFLLGLCASLLLALPSSGQYFWTTFAGQAGGLGSLDGVGTSSRFNNPNGIAIDSSGTIYVADTLNHVIRKITSAGVVTTLAGTTTISGSFDGLGSEARFNNPSSIAVDTAGTIYVADTNNHTIRKISPAGEVSTLAGRPRQSGYADGPASQAQFSEPSGVTVATDGTVYVSETGTNLIRSISTDGIVYTLAGSPGFSGASDGLGSEALFNKPTGLAVSQDGTSIYVADSANHSIRRVTLAGDVSTLAGSSGESGSSNGSASVARFSSPTGIAVRLDGSLTVTDSENHTLRRVTTLGAVTTIAGSAGLPGTADGKTISSQRFNTPSAVAMDSSGDLFITDTRNHTIRKLTAAGVLTTFAGSSEVIGSEDGLGINARFHHPNAVAVDKMGTLYVADSENHIIRKITPSGEVSTLAGSPGLTGSIDATGSAARFNFPYGIAVDANGIVYVADTVNHTIRKISPTGVVTTFAGRAGTSGSTNASGTSARFNLPNSLAVDASGTVYVADSSNFMIRKITAAGVVSTLAGNPNTPGSDDGTGTAAQFLEPYGIAVTSTGTVYVADSGNHTIRKITSSGSVTTFAGSPGSPDSLDGTGSEAFFNLPGALTVDPLGTVYVVDTRNHTIRKITSTGVVTTIGGQAGVRGGVDGMNTEALFSSPWGIAINAAGDLFIADYDNNRIVKAAAVPEIRVEQPALTELVDGVSSIDFGTILVGATSIKTFTIRSTGTGPLLGLAVNKDGPADSQFTVVSTTVPSTLAVGASTTFTVTFRPTQQTTGPLNAFLRITSSDETKSPFDIALTGVGIFPEITVEEPAATDFVDGTASINYGTVAIGSNSLKTFTIRNRGTSNLTGISVSKTGTASAQFIVSTTGMLATLAPGASTTFTVAFGPTGTVSGARTAALRIASNDGDENPFDIALNGSGVIPEIAVEHPTNTDLVDNTTIIAFGGVAIGTSSVKTFTIRNTGSGDLSRLAVTRDGTASAQFIVNTSTMSASLAPGTSTTFTVTFTPSGTSGTRAATLRIASNDANENPFDIPLTGSAFSPTADVDGDGLNDWAEFQLAALGFNWQTSSTALVTALRTNAAGAGFFTPTQLRAANPGETLLLRDPATQQFKLTLGLRKSTDLQNYSTQRFSTPDTSISSSGNVEFRFSSPEPRAFFRLQVE